MSVQTQLKADIQTRLIAMHAARAKWEEGTLRAANEELYAILENVYALYAELKTEVSKRRAFTALLTDLEVKTQANTSLALKVVRYVFAGQGRREVAYSTVIAIAHDMKGPDQSFTSYVQECGGIEEVRRVPKSMKPTSMSKADFKKLALEGLQEVQVGVTTFELPSFIQANTDYEEDYAVALVRCNENGTGTIVYGCNEAGIIDAVLVSSGKDLDERAQESLAKLDAGDLATKRSRDVREFASKMIRLGSNATVSAQANGAMPHILTSACAKLCWNTVLASASLTHSAHCLSAKRVATSQPIQCVSCFLCRTSTTLSARDNHLGRISGR